MLSKSPQKFFDLLESSIFYRLSKYGKFNKNAAILVHVRVLGAWESQCMTSKQEHVVVQFRHFPFVYLRVEWKVLRNPSKT